MALTEPATVREPAPTPSVAPKRSVFTRLSAGHVAMILAGIVAVLLNLAFLRSGDDPLTIAVARVDLQPGAVLDDGSVAAATIGEAGTLAGGFVTMEAAADLYGSVLSRPLGAGEPLRRSDFRPAGTAAGLRDYSVALDNADAAGGLIQAGDIVDVIATIDNRSFYVAAGLEVGRVTREGSGLEIGDELIVVLAVEDRTALELAAAQAAGHIALVRSTGAHPPTSGPVSLDSPASP